MSTVAPVVAGTLQHPPSQAPQQPQQQQQQQPSLMGGYHPPGSAIIPNNSSYGHTMAQNQAQAQQFFRQRQLMAYQQQRQAQLQLQLQQQQQFQQPSQQPSQKQTPPPQKQEEQDDQDHEKENRLGQHDVQPKQEKAKTPGEVSPVNSNDILLAADSTPVLDPSPTPLLISTSRSSVLNKRYRKKYSTGLAVLRLLQFAEQLSPGDQALHREFWNGFIADFFIPTSKTKWGLWNCETEERKSYYMSHHSMASFFHTLYECGVASIQLTLEQTMEYILPGGQMNVECPRANFIYRYSNGSLVSSTGHLWIRFSLTHERIWKIKHFEFACQGNEEFIARSHLVLRKDGSKLKKSGKNALPETPINSWGIPLKAYHILQMVDVALQIDDMIFYSLIAGTSARDSLNALALNMEKKMADTNDMATTPTTQSNPLTSSPTEMDMNLSPTKGPTLTSKKKATIKRPGGLTRRKSLKNDNKVILKEDSITDSQQDGSESNQDLSGVGEMDNTADPTSPVVKTQNISHPLQQQQQQQQAFFLQQRNRLLQQQAYQKQQAMLQMQQDPSLGSSPVPTPLSHQELPSDPQAMTYPHPSYPGTFGTRHSSQVQKQQEQQQQIDDMEEFIHIAEQSRKRRSSISESKKPPAARKKGISSK